MIKATHTTIRVLIADDHPLIRAGICTTLATEPSLVVVGEASNGDEAIALCRELTPDVLLLDLSMPGHSPMVTVTTLRQNYPYVKILVLTAYDDDAYVRGLKIAGVAGYILKDQMPRTIVRAIYGVMRGERWFFQQLNNEILYERIVPPQIPLSNPLTIRELGVLKLVVSGKTNYEIGSALGISEKTVEKHLGEVYTKLEVTTRVEAAVWAVRAGLV